MFFRNCFGSFLRSRKRRGVGMTYKSKYAKIKIPYGSVIFRKIDHADNKMIKNIKIEGAITEKEKKIHFTTAA